MDKLALKKIKSKKKDFLSVFEQRDHDAEEARLQAELRMAPHRYGSCKGSDSFFTDSDMSMMKEAEM